MNFRLRFIEKILGKCKLTMNLSNLVRLGCIEC